MRTHAAGMSAAAWVHGYAVTADSDKAGPVSEGDAARLKEGVKVPLATLCRRVNQPPMYKDSTDRRKPRSDR